MDKFQAEPLMMSFGLKIYDWILGPALILLGITILLGVASRTSLFLLGLLYISLTWGLILINQNDGVAWLGTHMVLVALALMLAENNRFTLTKKW
jgi:thiosulfate dehydrogenase [quinone] large subunit